MGFIKFTRGDKYRIAVIASWTVLISYLHYSTIVSIHALHGIYAELYYIPVLLGVIFFGLKGAIGSFLFVLVMYMPYLFLNLKGAQLSERLLAALFIGIFGGVTGSLIDKEKKYRDQSEKDRYLAGLGRAATDIVHDLKNPLITIIGFTNRILEKKSSCDDAIEAIADSAINMQRIVYDVLDFAKPVQLELKEQDVRESVRRSCEVCRVKADETGTTLSVYLPQKPVKALVDTFRLERALSNLISNAVEASGRGQTISVEIISYKVDLAIRISDNGAGMDRETIENIFIPFYTKKSYGTGLGMPIAKKIIEGHHGRININSRPGKGTTVEIWLPLTFDADEED